MKNGPVSIKELGAATCKRRCYDVIQVMEAAGSVRRLNNSQIELVVVAEHDNRSVCTESVNENLTCSEVLDPFDDDFIDACIFDDHMIY